MVGGARRGYLACEVVVGDVERQQTLQAGRLGEDVVKEEAVLLGAEEGNHGNICLGEKRRRRQWMPVSR